MLVHVILLDNKAYSFGKFVWFEFTTGSRRRKRKLPSVSELLNKSKEILNIGNKRKRKPVHYEFSTDPETGVRSNKGTYVSQRGGKWRKMGESTCAEDSLCEVEDLDGEWNFLRVCKKINW